MAPLPGLTQRQEAVLSYVISQITAHHVPPTVREICGAVGLASPSSAKYQLDALEKKGYISRDPRRPRTINVTEAGARFAESRTELHEFAQSPANPLRAVTAQPHFMGGEEEFNGDSYVNVPVVGRIAAGAPILAEQMVEDVFALPRQLTGEGELFTLRVHGDSMIEAAIADGDWVVVRRQPVAENGEIVAAMIDGEATVKVLERRNGHITLLPRNATYAPIPADNAEVLGRVVMVMRSL